MGPNLQALINGNCISSGEAAKLSSTQKDAIENLTQAQIEACIQVREAVGPVYNSFMI